MASQKKIDVDDWRMNNAHSERILDPQNAAGARGDLHKDTNSNGNEANLLKEEIKHLKMQNDMGKLRLENYNLKKENEIKDLKLKLENEINQLRNENEILKLRSENALLKAEKQFGIEKDVLIAEKMTLEQDVKALKAKNEELKRSSGNEINLEMEKLSKDILKCREEKREMETKYELLKADKIKEGGSPQKLTVENKVMKDELEIMTNKFHETEEKLKEMVNLYTVAPNFENMGKIDLVKFAAQVLVKQIPYPHHANMYKALRSLEVPCSTGKTYIFTDTSRKVWPNGTGLHIHMRDFIANWHDIEKAKVLHPTDNLKSLTLKKKDRPGTWSFENDNDFFVCGYDNIVGVVLVEVK